MHIRLPTALCFFFTLLCTCVSGQTDNETGSISGRVTTEGEPTEFANVVLLALKDSAVVKLELTDAAGIFTFTGIDSADYFIRTSGLGISQLAHPPFTVYPGQEVKLSDYEVGSSATTLETVEVTARKPFLEQKAGMLVVNVDQAITGQGGSVIDMLRKVPGVVVAGNRIQMAGKSGLTILIDGRPTKYMDIESLLRDMPADNIKSIEVISQPGAQYDAEGNGGVINIVLKKNSLLGTNGQIYAGGGYGELLKYRAGASLSHRVGKWNLTGGAAYNHNTWIEGLDLIRRFDDRTFDQSNRIEGSPESYSLRAGVDYDLTDRQRIGLNARYGWGDSKRTGRNVTNVLEPGTGQQLQQFTTTRDFVRPWLSLNTDVFYRIQLDTAGQELNFDLSYNRFTRDGEATLLTSGDGGFPDRTNLEPSEADIISGQVDYKIPINPQWVFKAGAKASKAELDNELRALVRQGGEMVLDEGLSNRFLYDEEIKAAYTNLTWEKGDFGANFGLRFEDTRMEGYNVTVDSLNERNFSQLFPSLSFSAPVAGPIGVSLAYSYRIERPSYYDLNPFISFIDPLTFDKGNPFLQPELVHSGQLSVTYEKQPFFNLSYDYTNDVIADVTEQITVADGSFRRRLRFSNYGQPGPVYSLRW